MSMFISQQCNNNNKNNNKNADGLPYSHLLELTWDEYALGLLNQALDTIMNLDYAIMYLFIGCFHMIL